MEIISNLYLMIWIKTEYIKVILETLKMLMTPCYLMGKIYKIRKRLELTRLTLKL